MFLARAARCRKLVRELAGCHHHAEALDFSPKVFIKSFCKSQFLHKFVNLSLIITGTENKLTNLCGN